MQAHKTEAVVQPDGKLLLEKLPFKEGDLVEVIVLERQVKQDAVNPYPLRGSVYRYDDPFEPVVPEEDWEALK